MLKNKIKIIKKKVDKIGIFRICYPLIGIGDCDWEIFCSLYF